MRRIIYGGAFDAFLQGLTDLGYYKATTNQEPCLNWRRGAFHILLDHKRDGRIIVKLHYDKATPVPPYHRAIQMGTLVRSEFERIVGAYKKVKQRRMEEKHEVSPSS